MILFAGISSLMKGDPASLYGATQDQIDEITKDMDKDQYKLWVFMQSEIWYGYILLCILNVLCIIAMIFRDSY